MTVLQACLNGNRSRAEHAAVPLTPDELALDARRAIAAGARELHAHPRGPDERDTIEPAPAAATIRAIRAACPGVPLGLTTGLWTTDGDADRRLACVEAWEELPDYVSVNLSEPGFTELCGLLGRRGVGIEAGVWTFPDAHALIESGVEPLRVLVESSEGGAADPVAEAVGIEQLLAEGGVSAPQLHHGQGAAAWSVLDAAIERGRDIRIGLEDTTTLPDGSPAPDNAALVAEAARRLAV